MATMIPTDSYFDPASGEKEMFEALKKLPEDYFVFHSYRLVQLIPDKGLNENEIDFLVFHPDYGCLFIECKNSRVKRDENGNWKYLKNENGISKEIPMKDPFDQAFSGQHNLFNKLRDSFPNYRDLINNCKFMVAVWLPKYFRRQIDEAEFGPNITKEIIISREALLYPDETCKQIGALMERMNRVHLVCKYEEELIIDSASGYRHNLSHTDAMFLYHRVLCPTFHAIVNLKKDYEDTYIELLEEQYVILDFLSHQRTAAISGASGTGKTLVAVERARRLSAQGDRVLFLCYNRNLVDVLERTNKPSLKNVDFFTLDSYGCKKCKTILEKLSYFDLKDVLETEMLEGSFEYKHIIVDEGQDFGKRNPADADIKSEILELLSNYGAGLFDNEDTSFFIFYDKNQLVNTKQLPQYLQEVDSKLTLYKNCRNTKNIATTAFSLLSTSPQMYDRAWDGDVPSFIFYSDKDELIKRLDNLVESLAKEISSERVIIACSSTLKNSTLHEKIVESEDKRTYYFKSNGRKTRVFTSPTFKGLEADDVIITDVTNESFSEGNCDFYVAASRAKKRLYVFIDRNKVDIPYVLSNRFPGMFPMSDKTKQLALAMHGFSR